MAIMDNPYGNLLALLQSGALGPGNGPIQPQNPQPGFRAPGTPGIAMPQQQQPGGQDPMQQAGGLMSQLAMFKKPPGWVPSTSGSEPGRTAGDADLGGYGGVMADPMAGATGAAPTIFSGGAGTGGFFPWLKGLF